jgi:hypothetical protein
MICSRRRQRRRTSDERLGDGRPGRRAAKVERSPQEHQIEVRRRNGRCKPARTRADRTLVLTEAGRGNSDGFVAFTGFIARSARERCAVRTALRARMLVECAERRGERHFLVEEASGRLASWRELALRFVHVDFRSTASSEKLAGKGRITEGASPTETIPPRRHSSPSWPGPIGEDTRRSILVHHEAA